MYTTNTPHLTSGTLASARRQVYIQTPIEASMERLGIDYWVLWKMDEREAFQRMQRLELGSDAPMYANLGRYYEPFEEIVAPISAQALEYAFPPYPPNTSAPSGPFGAGVPMGRAPLSHEFPRVEDISPIQNDAYLDAWLPQVFWPTPISPTLALNSPAIPASPTRIRRASLAEPEATRIDSLPVEDWNPIDGVKEDTKEYREDSEGEHRYAESTGEEEGYAAPGPSNRRGGKSIRRRREESAPYSVGGSTSKPPRKPRVVSDEDDFPHPSIPNPDGAREQAGYNTGKHKWWSQRVLRPLLSASPKPLSKDAILSIIKKDLGLEGDAWQAFHDQHLNSISQALTAGTRASGTKAAVFVRLKHTGLTGGRWWSTARVEGRTDAQIQADTGGWIPRTPTQA